MGVDSDGKLCFDGYWADSLYNKNSGTLSEYLKSCINIHDQETVLNKMFKENPFIGMLAVEDFKKNRENIDANRYAVIHSMMEAGHEVTVTSGSKRSGKTGTSVSLIEEAQIIEPSIIKTYVGAPNSELESQGWEIVANIEGLKKDAMAIQDEAAIFLNSRRGMSSYNVQVLENMPTLSHKNIKNWNVITQSTKRMDVGVLDFASIHIVKTYSDAFSLNVERGMITDDLVYEFMLPRAGYVKPDSSIKDWSFVRTGKFMCLMYCPLVHWYNDKVGKAFGRFDNDNQGIEWAVAMYLHDDYDVDTMTKYMHARGIIRPKDFWRELKEKTMLDTYPVSEETQIELKEVLKDGLIDEGSEQMEHYNKLLKRKKIRKG